MKKIILIILLLSAISSLLSKEVTVYHNLWFIPKGITKQECNNYMLIVECFTYIDKNLKKNNPLISKNFLFTKEHIQWANFWYSKFNKAELIEIIDLADIKQNDKQTKTNKLTEKNLKIFLYENWKEVIETMPDSEKYNFSNLKVLSKTNPMDALNILITLGEVSLEKSRPLAKFIINSNIN